MVAGGGDMATRLIGRLCFVINDGYYFIILFVPGSTDPRATTLSYPAGAFFKEELSLVMVCSLPRATSHRNITPVFLEVRTENTRQEKNGSRFGYSVTDI